MQSVILLQLKLTVLKLEVLKGALNPNFLNLTVNSEKFLL